MIKRLTFTLICVVRLAVNADAEFRVASVFTDHMVLQRGMPVTVWGHGDPGVKIQVKFAEQKEHTSVDSHGDWQVNLAPLPANFQPNELSVSTSNSNEAITFSDVVVGEVWICSGQSNMKWGHKGNQEIEELLSKSANVRCFEVKRTVALSEKDSCDGQWINEPPSSAVAATFAHFLQQASEVPVGIILTCWGSSSIEAWMPRDMTETLPHFKTIMQEFDADTPRTKKIQAILNGKKPWSTQDDIYLRRQPNILYNAMMHPLAPFACRGVVWYQGERNTRSMTGMDKQPWYARTAGMLDYGNVLQQWIERYRKQWKKDDLRFLIVSLPGFGATLKSGPNMSPTSPVAHSWAWIRESQFKARQLSGVSVSNNIDLGKLKNIHPSDKLPVGKRLALIAARETLGQGIEAYGPSFNAVEKAGRTLVVHFDHADGLRTSDGSPPKSFWIAEESGDWNEADAVIRGDTVVLQSPQINNPAYIRYAFAGKPDVNLVNDSGLPAYPFRTDTFAP